MSRCPAVIALMIVCSAIVAPAAAQTAAPATAATVAATAPTTTAPATAPATTNAAHDLSTPKGAVRSLATAMQSGDRDALLAVLHATSPTETRLANVMAELAEAMASLSRNAVTAYGEEGARPVTGDANDAADALARLDAALVKEQGDSATVGATEGDAGVSLVRVDGKWKFPVAALIKNADEAAVAQRLSDVEAQVGLFTEAAAEVKQGKYKTGDEVRQALDQRILQMVMQRPRATTAPTTAPAAPRP